MRYIRLMTLLLALLLCASMPCAMADPAGEAFSASSVSELPASNDELFDGYFERAIYGMEDVSVFGTSARNSLTPRQQKLYDYYKVNLQRVANGATANAYFSIQGTQTLVNMGYPASVSCWSQAEKNAAKEAFQTVLFNALHIVCDAIRFDGAFAL